MTQQLLIVALGLACSAALMAIALTAITTLPG